MRDLRLWLSNEGGEEMAGDESDSGDARGEKEEEMREWSLRR